MFFGAIATLCLFISCSVTRKNQRDEKKFARIVVQHPEFAANYCSVTYPVKDSFITHTDSIEVADTLWGLDFIHDTTNNFVITEPPVLKPKTIIVTKVITRVDTIVKISTADIVAANLRNGKLVDMLNISIIEVNKYKTKANHRMLINFGLIFLIAGYLFFKIRKKIKL